MFSMCGCGIRDNIRRDCHWYHCEHQMGASIDCCTLRENLGDCPCSDDCKDYIGYAEVNRILREHMKHGEQRRIAHQILVNAARRMQQQINDNESEAV